METLLPYLNVGKIEASSSACSHIRRHNRLYKACSCYMPLCLPQQTLKGSKKSVILPYEMALLPHFRFWLNQLPISPF